MLQNIKQTRGGFTLVEIMIVVAIIALLATLAAPNIMRARLRAQAAAVKADLTQLDAAIDQYAIEKNLATGATVATGSLAAYIKSNSKLATYLASGSAVDSLGNVITIPTVGGTLQVPAASGSALSSVADAAFWQPFTTGT